MPRFYFNVLVGPHVILDIEGTDLPSLKEAQAEALLDARSLMSAAILEGDDVISAQTFAADVPDLGPFVVRAGGHDRTKPALDEVDELIRFIDFGEHISEWQVEGGQVRTQSGEGLLRKGLEQPVSDGRLIECCHEMCGGDDARSP